MRKRTSQIWLLPLDEFKELVKNSDSIGKILTYFNLKNIGANYKTVRARIKEEKIDDSHIPRGLSSNAGRKFNKVAKDLDEVMVENSSYNRTQLKNRLIKENILENKCAICNLSATWNGKRLVMILDHINGVRDDNRLENLRLLCPNCNSQTDTFAGKNTKHAVNPKAFCACGNSKCIQSNKCDKCVAIDRRKVKQRPSKEDLNKQVEELGYCGAARKHGVSDNAIRKWLL